MRGRGGVNNQRFCVADIRQVAQQLNVVYDLRAGFLSRP